MLARAGLADADRLRGRGEAPAPLDLDQQAHAVRVPELGEDGRTHRSKRYALSVISSSAMMSGGVPFRP